MIEVYHFSQSEILAFVLVSIRVSVMFATWPVFGNETVPAHAKILTSLVVAMLIFPLVGWSQIKNDVLTEALIFLVVKEAFMGFTLGFLCRMFFLAISVCGEMTSLVIGLASDQIFNPSLGGRSTPVDQFYILVGTLFFLSVNGHHLFFQGLVESYRAVPLSMVGLNLTAFQNIGSIGGSIVAAGVKMCSPVTAAIFFVNMSLGIISRVVPQVNILVTSLAINILAGLVMMLVSIPLLIYGMGDLMNSMMSRLHGMLSAF